MGLGWPDSFPTGHRQARSSHVCRRGHFIVPAHLAYSLSHYFITAIKIIVAYGVSACIGIDWIEGQGGTAFLIHREISVCFVSAGARVYKSLYKTRRNADDDSTR